ncbi:MAG: hypothetical protein DDG58_07580 [Ardenticatenia bacterium]|nr:MAG: hypothetical protein DDG58_07580 [Ardenticatenia bacterium]
MDEQRPRSWMETMFHGDPFERLVVAIITSVTVLAAIITLLQTNASARAGQMGRDAQSYAIQAMGRRVTGQANMDYAWHAYQLYEELDVQALLADRFDDPAAAARYRALRTRIAELSPLLAPPYFDTQSNTSPNVERYEADTYLIEATALAERYAVAAALNNAWTAKANAYVTHLALLAVSLFLFGLATTVAGWIRWLFVGVGLLITGLTFVWILVITLSPIRSVSGQAIQSFAQGVGYAHQRALEQARDAFTRALQETPFYANAYYERANVLYDMGDYESAVQDYLAAQAAGRDDVNVAWNLGWTYYLLGRFDESIATSQHAVELDPAQVGVRFNVAIAWLAKGDVERARTEYAKTMEVTAQQVAQAVEKGGKPPASLWTYMDAAARDLEGLLERLRNAPRPWTEAPPRDKVVNPQAVEAAAEEIVRRLKSFTTALEYSGKPSTAAVTASISPFEFAIPTYDEEGNLIGRTIATAFPQGTDKVLALFDYSGMRDGQEVLWKLYHDGWEDPSWRLIEQWSLGESGSAEKPFSLSYTNLYQFTPGEFKIEMYVDNQFVQQGTFIIEPTE